MRRGGGLSRHMLIVAALGAGALRHFRDLCGPAGDEGAGVPIAASIELSPFGFSPANWNSLAWPPLLDVTLP